MLFLGHQTNSHKPSALRKLLFAGSTQAVILVFSFLTGIVMPRYMGTEQFGYYQIYMLYLAYLNLAGLGFNDGIALYYGGRDYADLPFARLGRAVQLFVIYISTIVIVLMAASLFFVKGEYLFICLLLSFSVFSYCLFCLLITTFLACGHTELYNICNLMQKAIFAGIAIVLIFQGLIGFRMFVIAEAAIMVCVNIFLCIKARKLLTFPKASMQEGFSELKEKCSHGIFITISAIMISLVPTFGRMLVQFNMSIGEYGIYSFAQSMVNIVFVFVTAFGAILFPIVKRIDEDKQPEYYRILHLLLKTIIYLFLWCYPAIYFLIRIYLPAYFPATQYLPLLLATCIPMSKIHILIVPFCKSWRKEKKLMRANLICLAAMVAVTSGVYQIFGTINSIALGSLLTLTAWRLFLEYYCFLKVPGYQKSAWAEELAVLLAFIAFYQFLPLQHAFFAYSLLVVIYLVVKKKQVFDAFVAFKKA
jgi:O-antigen/teichoic acid export membrane protein